MLEYLSRSGQRTTYSRYKILDGQLYDRYSPYAKVTALDGIIDQTITLRYHLLLTATGQVYVKGDNKFDIFGLGDQSTHKTFVQIPFDHRVIAIAGGTDHLVLLTSDGDVYTCGTNFAGQLGLGDTTRRKTYHRVPIDFKVAKIRAGPRNTALMTHDGDVYLCGVNSSGQMGLGHKQNQLSALRLGFKVLDIAIDESHIAVLTTGGEVYTCGDNQHGQLGLGDCEARTEFTRVPGLRPIQHLIATNNTTMVIDHHHTLFVCGLNQGDKFGLQCAPDDDADREPFTTNQLSFIELFHDVHAVTTSWKWSMYIETLDRKVFGSGYDARMSQSSPPVIRERFMLQRD